MQAMDLSSYSVFASSHCREWIDVKKAKGTPRSMENPPGNGADLDTNDPDDAVSDDAGDAFMDADALPQNQDGDASK